MRPFAEFSTMAFLPATLIALCAGAATVSPAISAEFREDRISIAFETVPQAPALEIERVAAPIVQKVIARQIDAVRHSDAKTAFSFVSSKLRQRFATDAAYLQVVKQQFPAIASARIISFGALKRTSFGMAQEVKISDATGQPWLALFLVDEERTGDWQITNVVMVKMPAIEV